jgi:hypothetical protein
MTRAKEKTKELRRIMMECPDRELIFMYPDEGSDWGYTMGEISRIFIDEYTVYDDRVCIRADDDYLEETFYEQIAEDLFPWGHKMTEIDEAKVEWLLKERMEEIEWKKAIIVYLTC